MCQSPTTSEQYPSLQKPKDQAPRHLPLDAPTGASACQHQHLITLDANGKESPSSPLSSTPSSGLTDDSLFDDGSVEHLDKGSSVGLQASSTCMSTAWPEAGGREALPCDPGIVVQRARMSKIPDGRPPLCSDHNAPDMRVQIAPVTPSKALPSSGSSASLPQRRTTRPPLLPSLIMADVGTAASEPGLDARKASSSRPPLGLPPAELAVRVALRRSGSTPALSSSSSAPIARVDMEAAGGSAGGSVLSPEQRPSCRASTLDEPFTPPSRQFRPRAAHDDFLTAALQQHSLPSCFTSPRISLWQEPYACTPPPASHVIASQAERSEPCQACATASLPGQNPTEQETGSFKRQGKHAGDVHHGQSACHSKPKRVAGFARVGGRLRAMIRSQSRWRVRVMGTNLTSGRMWGGNQNYHRRREQQQVQRPERENADLSV